MRYMIFSSTGLLIDEHPIYEVAAKYRPESINLFASNEKHPKNIPQERSAEENVKQITKYFSKTFVKTKVTYLQMKDFSSNVYTIASQIIQECNNYDNYYIILDISAGRGPISHALSRAGHLVNDYLEKTAGDSDYSITCVLRPAGHGIVDYSINIPAFPLSKDLELLDFLSRMKRKMSQTSIASKLDLGNQSVVSKAVQRLRNEGYLETNSMKLTTKGFDLLKFSRNL